VVVLLKLSDSTHINVSEATFMSFFTFTKSHNGLIRSLMGQWIEQTLGEGEESTEL